MDVIHTTFMSIGDIAEPKEQESIWAWDDRTKNYSPNLRDAADMKRMFCHCEMHQGAMAELRDHPTWQSYEDQNEHIMVWNHIVFFSSEDELAIFKLAHHAIIHKVIMVTKKSFKYVNR